MSATSANMDRVVAALRRQLGEARAQVGGGFSFGVASDLQAQYLGQLNQAQSWIDRLDTDLRARVEDGGWPASSWMAIAQQQAVLIASTQGASASDVPSLSSFWTDVVAQTGADLADKTSKVASAVVDGLPWYFTGAIVGLIALAIIRVGRG